MAADLQTDPYVQKKKRGNKLFFYFRVVRKGQETRIALPHPFDDGYRAAYDAAWERVFGVDLIALENPTCVRAMVREHKASAKYSNLSPQSRVHRTLSCDLLVERIGDYDGHDIRPVHAQAIYDSLADRPPTANRRADDMSAIFRWGSNRGYCDGNPFERIERISNTGSYEPWPAWALERLLKDGKPHLIRPVLLAVYTGQRRGDILTMSDEQIDGKIWRRRQGKTKTFIDIPLHPVALAVIEEERTWKRANGIVDPRSPLLRNSKGNPWASGFSASWTREMVRLKLHAIEPRLVFHGLRHTNATVIASAVAQNPGAFGGIERVKSMLGHLSDRMAEHYARRAERQHMNADTILLIPDIGNTQESVGNTGQAGKT